MRRYQARAALGGDPLGDLKARRVPFEGGPGGPPFFVPELPTQTRQTKPNDNPKARRRGHRDSHQRLIEAPVREKGSRSFRPRPRRRREALRVRLQSPSTMSAEVREGQPSEADPGSKGDRVARTTAYLPFSVSSCEDASSAPALRASSAWGDRSLCSDLPTGRRLRRCGEVPGWAWRSHKPPVVGSSPAPATQKRRGVGQSGQSARAHDLEVAGSNPASAITDARSPDQLLAADGGQPPRAAAMRKPSQRSDRAASAPLYRPRGPGTCKPPPSAL